MSQKKTARRCHRRSGGEQWQRWLWVGRPIQRTPSADYLLAAVDEMPPSLP